jgi:hypothetical protein
VIKMSTKLELVRNSDFAALLCKRVEDRHCMEWAGDKDERSRALEPHATRCNATSPWCCFFTSGSLVA